MFLFSYLTLPKYRVIISKNYVDTVPVLVQKLFFYFYFGDFVMYYIPLPEFVTIILFIFRKKQPKEKEDRADKKLKDVCRYFFLLSGRQFSRRDTREWPSKRYLLFYAFILYKIFQKPRQWTNEVTVQWRDSSRTTSDWRRWFFKTAIFILFWERKSFQHQVSHPSNIQSTCQENGGKNKNKSALQSFYRDTINQSIN